MGILVLSIVAGIVVAGGIWLATCETKPAGRETGGRLVKTQIASARSRSASIASTTMTLPATWYMPATMVSACNALSTGER